MAEVQLCEVLELTQPYGENLQMIVAAEVKPHQLPELADARGERAEVVAREVEVREAPELADARGERAEAVTREVEVREAPELADGLGGGREPVEVDEIFISTLQEPAELDHTKKYLMERAAGMRKDGGSLGITKELDG